jgi:hypothetical protein
MRPRAFLLLTVTILIAACHNGAVVSSPSQLNDSTMYAIDAVRAVMSNGNDAGARKTLAAALGVYKNIKDVSRSVPLFKQAIRYKPGAQAYYELGCALLDEDEYKESVKALGIAEQLGYNPRANVLARLASAHSRLWDRFVNGDGSDSTLRGNDSLALHYMEVSIQMGYPNPADFQMDVLYTKLRACNDFQEIFNNAVSGGSALSPEQLLWVNFKNEFEPVDLPLVINLAWVRDHPLDKNIDYNYEKFVPEMRTQKFSRDVDKEFYYYALIKKDTAYTALLYCAKSVAGSSETMPPPQFYLLVTYDATGKIIDKMQVVGQQKYSDAYKVFSMQADFSFEVQDFKNVYKNDPVQAGYDSNEVVSTEPQTAAYYRIAVNGKFEKTNAPLAMR